MFFLNLKKFYTMGFLLRLFFTWIAIIVSSQFLPGIHINNYVTALIAAAVLALLDSFVKPILVFLTIPITLITLGLFLLVINAAIVLLGARLVQGFEVDSFWWALAFSLVVSLIVTLLEMIDRAFSRK
jgi:putative membrane protein